MSGNIVFMVIHFVVGKFCFLLASCANVVYPLTVYANSFLATPVTVLGVQCANILSVITLD